MSGHGFLPQHEPRITGYIKKDYDLYDVGRFNMEPWNTGPTLLGSRIRLETGKDGDGFCGPFPGISQGATVIRKYFTQKYCV